MEPDLEILVEADGTVRFVYSDELAEVFAGETLRTARASHVEPHPHGGGWYADMVPVRGPVLGADGTVIRQREFMDAGSQERVEALWAALRPFPTRQAALDAERAWLRQHLGV